MTLSPFQNQYVTKKEFNEFKSYVHEGFEMTNKHIDNLEINMNAKFAAVDKRFEAIDKRFDGIDARFEVVDKRFDVLEAKLSDLTTLVTKIATKIL